MPLDYKRTAMVAGMAGAVDYLVGSKLFAALPDSATTGLDENAKSSLRTAIAVAVADLISQNL
jgi:hypothetical protein